MTLESEYPLSLTEKAAEWLETIDEATPAERAAFVAWLKESPRHVGEFLAVAAVSREFNRFDSERQIDLEALAVAGCGNVVTLGSEKREVTPIAKSDKSECRSRKWLVEGVPSIAAILAAIGLGVAWLLTNFGDAPRYETAVGEQRTVELPDGSLVFLNARSRLEVRYSPEARDLKLLSGEGLFKVAKESKRPFQVDIGTTVVQAVGTQFNIYRRAEGTTVSVLEGKVQLSKKEASGFSVAWATHKAIVTPTALVGGQEANIATDGRMTRIEPMNEVKVTAWRQRHLIFRSDRLADVAAEFNRYNRSPQIRVAGEVARERRLTGIFDADDPRSLIQFLAQSDLSVRREGNEVLITPRD